MIPTQQILIGDVRETIRQIPDNSVHCVVTSPPYFLLRKYGDDSREMGLEKTPTEYVANMVALFREVRRILRPDGTLWLNIGDSYNTKPCTEGVSFRRDRAKVSVPYESGTQGGLPGLKPKDLIGIPWRLAFALQADGWYLRSDIIWAKPNPMPESVYDRPTKSHEYLFLLTKKARYFYDSEAILEPVSENTHLRISQDIANQQGSLRANGGAKTNGAMKAVTRGSGVNPKAQNRTPSGWARGENRKHEELDGRFSEKSPRVKQNASFTEAISGPLVTGRNKRSVWTITTEAFSGAHFATFPKALVRPCIMAGASEGGCCAKCGAPRERIVEHGAPDLDHQKLCGGDKNGEYHGKAQKDFEGSKAQNDSEVKARILAGMCERRTVGWKKTCKCETDEIIPCTVFDPFLGSGTTAQVANELGRSFVGCELYEKFKPLINERNKEPFLL